MEKDKNIFKEFIPYKVGTWVVGIILIVMGWLIIYVQNTQAKVDSLSDSQNKISVQLSQIQTDLAWIKSSLSGNKDKNN